MQAAHEIQDLCLNRDVERRCRFVANDKVGIAGERAGDRDTLALTAGKLVRVLRGVFLREADLAQ